MDSFSSRLQEEELLNSRLQVSLENLLINLFNDVEILLSCKESATEMHSNTFELRMSFYLNICFMQENHGRRQKRLDW